VPHVRYSHQLLLELSRERFAQMLRHTSLAKPRLGKAHPIYWPLRLPLRSVGRACVFHPRYKGAIVATTPSIHGFLLALRLLQQRGRL